MNKPRLLDLFCGAGGAAMGYSRAGFEVVGVDIKPQPRYPFEFVQDDALALMSTYPWWDEPPFHAIHASPPCQRWSTATKRNGTEGEHPDLIGTTREALGAPGLPYVIENVVGAPLVNPQLVCGTERGCEIVGYRLRRHRLFEMSFEFDWRVFRGCECRGDLRPVLDVTGGGPTLSRREDGGGGRPFKGTADQARAIMGIDWMTKAELNEAIPPLYTELIGSELMAYLKATVVA